MISRVHIKILKMVHKNDVLNRIMAFSFLVLNEVKWAYVILNDKPNVQNHSKSWKRCKILQTTILKLKYYFIDDESKENITFHCSKGKDIHVSPVI